MRLLLTSKGITNESIKAAFLDLLGKDIADSQIAFVTTAGYYAEGNKSWFVDEMLSVRSLNPKVFEIIEFNSLSREEIIKRLDNSDAVFLSGGNSAALMHSIDSKNLREILRKFAAEKLYCGISASSHIVSPDLRLSTPAKVEAYAKQTGYLASSGLALVDFYVRAHYKEQRFPHLTEQYVQNLQAELGKNIYAIDDQSALSVNAGEIKIVSEGDSKLFG